MQGQDTIDGAAKQGRVQKVLTGKLDSAYFGLVYFKQRCFL